MSVFKLGELRVVDTSDIGLACNDICVEVLWGWLGVGLDLLNISINVGTDFLLDLLKFGLCCPALFKEHSSDELNGVTVSSNLVDLLAGSVGDSGVGHGVTMISIGNEFNEEGTVAFGAVILCKAHCLTHDKNVLAVDFEAWNQISSSVELGVVRSSIVRGSHSVEVVLAHVDHWKFPESSHVSSFIDLTLVGSTITIHSNCYIRFVLILDCKGKPSADWNLSSNNTISSVEVVLGVIVMHRATLSCS